jgi:hypothetical protein
MFPDVRLTSWQFVASVVALVVDHVVWHGVFSAAYQYTLPQCLAFFVLFIYLVPLSFFISMNVGDGVLPTSGSSAASSTQGGRKSKCNLMRILDCCHLRRRKGPLPMHSHADDDLSSNSGSGGGASSYSASNFGGGMQGGLDMSMGGGGMGGLGNGLGGYRQQPQQQQQHQQQMGGPSYQSMQDPMMRNKHN